MKKDTSRTSVINVRIDAETKDGATAVLSDLGLTVSDAVRMLLTHIVREGRVPAWLFMDEKSYDDWFRAKVREAMDDERPRVPHDVAMDRIRDNLEAATERKDPA